MAENELQQAIGLIKAGNKSEAVPILKGILKTDRNNELAWLWLSSCVDKTEDKIYCIQEALRINPENQNAQKALNRLSPRIDEPTIEDMVPKKQQAPERPKQKVAPSVLGTPLIPAERNNNPHLSTSKKNAWLPYAIGLVALLCILLVVIGGILVYRQIGNGPFAGLAPIMQTLKLGTTSTSVDRCSTILERFLQADWEASRKLNQITTNIWRARMGCTSGYSCTNATWIALDKASGCEISYEIYFDGVREIVGMYYIDLTSENIYAADDPNNLGLPSELISAEDRIVLPPLSSP